MKILGIDTGIAIAGWSILETNTNQLNNTARLIDCGAVFTESTTEIEIRLRELFDGLDKVIKEYKPTVMAVESIFFFKNQKTIINVSQARGVILLAASKNNIPVFSYTPLQVKTAVTGYGRADKKQIQKMIKLIYNLKEVPKPDDVADAIAVATCHGNTAR